MEAIENLGFGRTGKVFLEFARPFWCAGQEVIKVAWGRERLEDERRHWTTSVLGFDEVLGNPRVLVCWLAGRGAAETEKLDDNEVLWLGSIECA